MGEFEPPRDVPPELPSELPPEPASPSRGPTVLAWAVILTCVGTIVIAGLRPRPPEPLAVERDPRAGHPPPSSCRS